MLPAYLDTNWAEGNFLIHHDEKIRGESRKALVVHSCDEAINTPQHQKVRTELLARIAATKAYDLAKMVESHTSEQRHSLPLPRYLFTKAWLESDFSIPMDKKRCADLKLKYSGYLNIGEVWVPGNEKTREKLKTYIAAIDAIDAGM